jgi:peptidoglycan-associated lipoprotein
MKAIRFGTLIAAGAALCIAATGCHPENLHRIPGRYSPPPDVNPAPFIPPGPTTETTNTGNIEFTNPYPTHTNWAENRDALKDYSVHFAYDSSAIRSADKSKITSVADYLKANPTAAVRVEGNCDERGTEEYNRSLGERRALAGREELVRLGITSDRVDTLSYGEDKPANPGHNESAWKENRRDDFVVLTPPGK